MDTARRIEACVRVDAAMDQLLTAYLVAQGQDLLTPEQEAAISHTLDVIDLDTFKAWHLVVGLDLTEQLRSTRSYSDPDCRLTATHDDDPDNHSRKV